MSEQKELREDQCEVQRGQSVWVEGQIVHGGQPTDFPKRARIHIHGIGTGIPMTFKPVTEAPASLSTGRLEELPTKWRNEPDHSDDPFTNSAFKAGLRIAAFELEAALNERQASITER
jgi:hypothetical protein